jgi:YfiR/HmsC-like
MAIPDREHDEARNDASRGLRHTRRALMPGLRGGPEWASGQRSRERWRISVRPGLSRWVVRSAAMVAERFVLLAGVGDRGGAQMTEEEYRIKAAFIFHFAQLVDWPPDTPIDTENSLFVCTLGEDPFQGALEGSLAGKLVGNRVMRIRHLAQAQNLQSCQILFIGKGQSKRIPALLTDLHHAPVLTVGETAGFVGVGGMIGFLLQQNKVRFEINLAAAESARLKIRSRLLMLAQTVVRESARK